MKISNPAIFDYIKETNGALMRLKIEPIGDWDMSAVGTLTKAHGLTLAKIRIVKVIIRNDADNLYTDMDNAWAAGQSSGRYRTNGTNVIMDLYPGVQYDNANYDALSYNRGWIYIWYED